MTAPDLATPYVRNPDTIGTDMDGETVMMSIERGEYYGIGGVGSRIWELLEHPVSMAEIVQAICAEFEVDETTCVADLNCFISELQVHGLVCAAQR